MNGASRRTSTTSSVGSSANRYDGNNKKGLANSSSDPHILFDKEVDDLRERMLLLQQERRTNIDKLEANKVANDTEIRALKEDNTKMKMKLSSLQKSAALDNDGNNRSDVDSLKKLVLQKRNEYDVHKSAVFKLSNKLTKLEDEARCLVKEQKPNLEEGPLSRQIRSLEDRLDKAMIQYNEAHGICSTYEHIVKRLVEEKESFDNQLTALERTLESKHHDLEELTLLSTDANHAREMAQQNLQKAKVALEDGKSRRLREIRERQQHVRIRKQMIAKHERSDDEKRKVVGTANNSNNNNHNDLDLMTMPVPIGGNRNSNNMQTTVDQEHALNVYEAAFRKIKDATGVNNVDHVIRKVLGQSSTTENLKSVTLQNQVKLENLRQLQAFLLLEVDKMKHISDVSGSSQSSKVIDEHHELLYLRSSMSERTKSRLDCVSVLIMSIKAGVEHLREKFTNLRGFAEFDVVGGHGALSEDQLSAAIRSSGDLLVDVLRKTEDNELQQLVEPSPPPSVSDQQQQYAAKNLQNRRPTTTQGVNGGDRPFNQRITLPSAKETSAFDHDYNDNEEFGTLGEFDAEEEISRDGVKKASSIVINAMEDRRTVG